MLDELSERELGVGFIYTLLDLFAERHRLSDVVVVLDAEHQGRQVFRRGGQTISPDSVARFAASAGLYCEPNTVSGPERDAVRTACQLVFALHLARYRATHDPLTSLANRRSFDTALEEAAARSARYGWVFTLVVMDLNGFKAVNDTTGHGAGDELLRQFGFALRQCVRQGDTAARIGGDEFAVILSNAEGGDSLGFIERLRNELAVVSNLLDFTAGTATSPRDAADPRELLRIADDRLYEKKGNRRS